MAEKIRHLLGVALAGNLVTGAAFLFLFSLTPIAVAIASLGADEDVVCTSPIEATLTWSDAFRAEVMELELHARRVISLTP